MKCERITKAELEIHDNLVIVRFDEGRDVTIEDWMEIKEMLLNNFSGKFAWISDRINSYSIDPTLLLLPEVIYTQVWQESKNSLSWSELAMHWLWRLEIRIQVSDKLI